MVHSTMDGKWVFRAVRSAAAVLLLSAGLAVAAPADEKKPDDANPTEGPELLQPKGAATTKPATQPAKPKVEVSAEARELLDAVRDAYKNVKTMKVAGTITSDIDVNSQQQKDKVEISGTFESPMKFRHETREPAKAGGEAKPATLFGSTGKKLYAFEPRYNYYYLADAPQERTVSGKLPEQVAGLLSQLNPALLLAVVPDAAEELLDGVDKIEKIEDVKIDDVAHPALKLTFGKEAELTASFDPKTHLLRRLEWDRKGYAIARKQQDVNKVLITVDYTMTDAAASLQDVDFAWEPPAGARDVTTLADAGAADDAAPGPGQASALVGKDAPDFTLKDLEGKEVKLSDLKGSVILLDFWATWCGPCRASMPHLDKIHSDMKDQGLKAYAVNIREGEGEVKKFVEQTSLGMPVLFDKDGGVAKRFGVSGIPQTVVVDKEGKIVKVVVGSGTHEQVRKAIEEALK